MTTVLAKTQITLVDLNDAIIAGTAPSTPVNGTLWIDSSQTPNVLKQWNGSAWVTQTLALSSLDNTSYTNLQNNITAISDMSNDLKITQSERIAVKDQIQEMVGSVPTDTYTLPAIATIDSSGAGELYQVRKAALNAGIATSASSYTTLGNAYTTLQGYLNGLSPLPWNTTNTSTLTITSSWRTNWNAYYSALYALQQATAAALQGNIDGVQVGGRNYIQNSLYPYLWYCGYGGTPNDNVSTTSFASSVNGTYIPLMRTMNHTSGNTGDFRLSNTWGSNTDANTTLTPLVGRTFTFSAYIQSSVAQSVTLWITGTGDDDSSSQAFSLSANTWTKITMTKTFASTTHTGVRIRVTFPSTSGVSMVMAQLEEGTRATSWNPAPEDLVLSTQGGRNYLKNTALMNDLTNWSQSTGSAVTATLNVVNDSTYGGVVDYNVTTNASTGNYWKVISNVGLTLPGGKFIIGNTYTVSFLIWTALDMYVNFMDSNGANPVTFNSPTIPANTKWTKFSYTFVATATGNTPELYLASNDTTHTGHVYVTQVKLEDGNTATGYSPAPEDTNNQIMTLNKNVYDVQQKISDNAIISTVTNSDTYTSALNAKANSSDLAGLATQGDVDNAQSNANVYTDQQIQGLNMSSYVTQSTLTQTSDSLTAQFSSSGGVNMLQNSVGYSGTDFWTIGGSGTVAVSQDPALEQFGSGSGFVITNATLDQTISVTPGVPYTLSVIVNKGSAGTGYIQLSDGSSAPAKLTFSSGSVYNYQSESINITPTTNTITVELSGDSASGGVLFSCVMLNIGSNPFTWQQHMGEVYNANINFDINGIRVSQLDDNGNLTGYTVMTPTKFAGYTDQNNDGVIDSTTGSVDEVFRMDKDAFNMKGAIIGPIKIIQVTTGGYNGIAFIPS